MNLVEEKQKVGRLKSTTLIKSILKKLSKEKKLKLNINAILVTNFSKTKRIYKFTGIQFINVLFVKKYLRKIINN